MTRNVKAKGMHYSHKDIAAAFAKYEELGLKLKQCQKKQDILLLAKTIESAAKGKSIQKALDTEIAKQDKELILLRQKIMSAYAKFSEIDNAYWHRNVLQQPVEPEDPLAACGAYSPVYSWKLGYGSFYSNNQDTLSVTQVPVFFNPNERRDPWEGIFDSDRGIIYPAKCGLTGGWGFAHGILGFGIDVTSGMCGCELLTGISASGIVDIGPGQNESQGVRVRLSIEVAQYRGHNVPIADLGVKELHPYVSPEKYRYWSFSCTPGMEYSTSSQGLYPLPALGDSGRVCCNDVQAGDAFVVEYQFAIYVSPGCGVAFLHDNQGTIIMNLPTFIRHEYPPNLPPSNGMIVLPTT